MNIIIDGKYRWQQSADEELKYWFIGSRKTVNQFISFFRRNPDASAKYLKEELNNTGGHFAVIVEQENRLIATVDKIRSYPVFYFNKEKRFAISNSARALKIECELCEIDDLSVLEFSMGGYVTARETIYKYLYQLQAGEFLIWHKDKNNLKRIRYYTFYPTKLKEKNEDVLIEELDKITNEIFTRTVEEANGRPIWIPLSGGYDSRLIVCKLRELGYDKLQTYSYGLPGNHEAKAAKVVAEKLGLPWLFVPLIRKEMRQYFWSEERKKYSYFADGLCSIPVIQDISALTKMRNTGDLPEEAVLINGQSGDFITGGHITEELIQNQRSIHRLLDAIVNKHMSLWLDRKTLYNISKIKDKISSLLPPLNENNGDYESIANLYEYWEWQERQSKYVVNEQRIYDYLCLSWQLPLWQKEYLDFWRNVPVERKLGQNLYLSYLRKYNYKNLFKEFSTTIWRWPGPFISLVVLAQIIKLVFGNSRKERFYKYASYFGHYGSFYGIYGWKYFMSQIGQARNPISFFVKTWIDENICVSRTKGFSKN